MVDSNKLKDKIISKGYTQENLAKYADMSVDVLKAKINGQKIFMCDEIDAICATLNITSSAEKAEIFLS